MHLIIKYILGLSFIAAIVSCKKFVDVSPPIDSEASSEVFANDTKATTAVTSIYGDMINGAPAFCNLLATKYFGYSSDELQKFNAPVADAEFIQNTLSPNNSWVMNIWKSLYNKIYNANAAIEGLQDSRGVSQTIKEELMGECKFIRALCYLYLINIYGDVPLVSSTDYNINATLGKTSSTEIFDFILSDLSSAKNNLPTTYIGNEKVRPNKWAAIALLSRYYLYKKDWANAESEANEVIESGIFTPLQSPNMVFLKNSKEAIWQLMPKSGVLKEVNEMKPAGSNPTPLIMLSSQLLNSFETGDKRRMNWVDSITYMGNKYYYPAKYRNTTSTITEYYMVLRIAEQYLIRAEARCKQNNLAGAVDDLNVIRERAGLSDLPNSFTQDEILTAIMQERKIELFAEWGHRWIDLKRTGSAEIILSPIKPNWQNIDLLYPIPQDDILKNPNLTQNPGY